MNQNKQDDSMLLAARQEINRIDRCMAKLFCERMDAVRRVAEYKRSVGIPVLDASREAEVIARNAALLEDDSLRTYYVNYLKYNMALSRKFQHALLEGQRIAFSGVPGAFADIAAARIFPDGVRVPCADFKAAYEAVVNGDCECAVLPVENSTNGDVSQVIDLAYAGGLCVTGLYDLEIEQCLLAVKGTDISRIRRVSSHPQALGQCAEYIRRYRWEESEAVNTAVAAKNLAESGDQTLAVIASKETAALYGLQILEKKINRSSRNVTRFAVFSRSHREPTATDAHFTMFFTVKNEAGSLMRAMQAIGEHGFNLSTLTSRPTKEANWEYYFYVEGDGCIASAQGMAMLDALRGVCGTIRVLGSFDAIRPLYDPDDPAHTEKTADRMLDEYEEHCK
ncbi:MAG: chorismate mutase [Clostridia bacterium]|nr:chorismate mutase [Clostridia bacterium]